MKLFFTLFLSTLFYQAYAQSNCPCCSAPYKQFDFWLGEWQVLDTAGNKVGENTIKKLEDNCIMTEYWRGNKGGTGRSTNFYDRKDKKWHQLWVDNKGSVLRLSGKFVDGKMILKSKKQKSKSGKYYYNQVSWSLNKDNTVTQLWEIYSLEGKLISTAFLGIYHRKK